MSSLPAPRGLRLCEECRLELFEARAQWMARPQADPDSLRGVRLAHGVCIRELSRRTRISPEMISRVERGLIKSWPRYVEQLTAALGV